jgi:acetylornithine/succinyldiaminopimelate/putrescine aminotransferase
MIAFDMESEYQTHHIQKHLLLYGVKVSIVGPQTIGIKPSLTLKAMQAAHLRDALDAYYPDMNYD